MDKQQVLPWIEDERNLRYKLIEYEEDQLVSIARQMEQAAQNNGITKLIVYARKRDIARLEALGYRQEGVIDGFFCGEDAQMMARFLSVERETSAAPELEEEIIRLCLEKQGNERTRTLPPGYHLRQAVEADAEELAQLYKSVFSTYPTPTDDPAYIRETMRASTYYYVIEAKGQIVCAASAEVTPKYGSAEITDCATHPDHLGKGLLQALFPVLEKKMLEMGIYYLYTLTRAQSHGMNLTAAKMGYTYRGRLINNCTIYSGFEDMNIWVKPFRPTWS